MLASVRVQHELSQGAVHAGNAALHQREAAAGNFDCSFEAETAECFAQLNVILTGKSNVLGVFPNAALRHCRVHLYPRAPSRAADSELPR